MKILNLLKYELKGTDYCPEEWFGLKNDFFCLLLFCGLNDILNPLKAEKSEKNRIWGVKVNSKDPYYFQFYPWFFKKIKIQFLIRLHFIYDHEWPYRLHSLCIYCTMGICENMDMHWLPYIFTKFTKWFRTRILC